MNRSVPRNAPSATFFSALSMPVNAAFVSVFCGLCAASDRPVSLYVMPAEIRIEGKNRQQHLLVSVEFKSGQVRDVTHRCEVVLDNSKVATQSDGIVYGVMKGQTRLTVRFGSLEQHVDVHVGEVSAYPRVHFRSDVLPILSKLGCNSGGCHGKQSGQNGFRLSVFGFDPAADHHAITAEARGRRVFPSSPNNSLLLQKATGRTPHGGGRRTDAKSPDATLLENWILQGMSFDDPAAARIEAIEVFPSERAIGTGARQRLLVTAVYSDGARRDVTSDAAYTSNAQALAKADEGGLVHTGRTPGEAAITINYMGHVAVARLLIPRADRTAFDYDIPGHNAIDYLVWAKLRKLGIEPSGLSDDATFLRRMYLDAIGTLPEPWEVQAFLADDGRDKRQRAIDEVLWREEYADYWALKWADILLVDREKLGEQGAYLFHRWLRDQMATNRPYDQWVRELITATGNTGKNGPTNFFRAITSPEDLAKSVSQAFLGVRLDCAQCHHHPFDKWSQEDFYGMAGFFSGVERKALASDRALVYHAGYRQTTMPRTGTVVATRPLGGDISERLSDRDPRVVLAEWLTDSQNPWFARLIANRLWKHFLGRGLVEPEDDLRLTNPATNEPLLALLTDEVRKHRFDLKQVMRLIMNSRVYQLSSQSNATNYDDQQNFSHYTVKRMPAEVLLDAISQVTGSPEEFAGMRPGTRAIQLWDNRCASYFLETFGRSERTSPCECGKSSEPTMAQALHLMNGPEIQRKISDPHGRVAEMVSSGMSVRKIVDQLCLTALGRLPREKEQRIAENMFTGIRGSDARAVSQAAQDFTWTLLNSYDFLFIQ